MTERTMEGGNKPERSKIRSLQYYDGTGWPQLIQGTGPNMWTSPVWQPTHSDAPTIDDILHSRLERGVILKQTAAKLAEVESSNAELARLLELLQDYYCVNDCRPDLHNGNHRKECVQARAALATSDKGAGG